MNITLHADCVWQVSLQSFDHLEALEICLRNVHIKYDTVDFIGLTSLTLFALQVYSLQHSKEDRLAYLDHIPGGEITVQLLVLVFGVLALSYLSGCYVRLASQILAVLLPLVVLFIDGNIGYWHRTCRVEFWNQIKLIGQNVGIFGAVLILATDS